VYGSIGDLAAQTILWSPLTGRNIVELVLISMVLFLFSREQVKGPGSRAYKRFVAARIIQRWIKKYVSMGVACWFTLRAHASRFLHT
jgi:hypothetical protein